MTDFFSTTSTEMEVGDDEFDELFGTDDYGGSGEPAAGSYNEGEAVDVDEENGIDEENGVDEENGDNREEVIAAGRRGHGGNRGGHGGDREGHGGDRGGHSGNRGRGRGGYRGRGGHRGGRGGRGRSRGRRGRGGRGGRRSSVMTVIINNYKTINFK